jgi:hypothetical protein
VVPGAILTLGIAIAIAATAAEKGAHRRRASTPQEFYRYLIWPSTTAGWLPAPAPSSGPNRASFGRANQGSAWDMVQAAGPGIACAVAIGITLCEVKGPLPTI